MMEIECPKCFKESVDLDDILPSHACDEVDYQCEDCGHTCRVGWFAEAEIRSENLLPVPATRLAQ